MPTSRTTKYMPMTATARKATQRQIGKKLGAAGADHADEERQRQRVGHHHLVEGEHLLLLEVVTARRDIAEQNGDDGWKQRS